LVIKLSNVSKIPLNGVMRLSEFALRDAFWEAPKKIDLGLGKTKKVIFKLNTYKGQKQNKYKAKLFLTINGLTEVQEVLLY
jgi:hypothetical protein